MSIHSVIVVFRWCIVRLILRLFTLPPFVPFLQYCLRHDVYSACSVLSLSFSLVFSILNYFYTLCSHNNIYILHTHTHVFHLLILQHACLYIHYYRCFFLFERERKKKHAYVLVLIFKINIVMPSVDSNSSYSSSDSSTSSLSSPRALLTDIRQQQAIQQHHHQMKTTTSSTPQITQSHICVTRYKTELCRPFTETGKCKYGDKCQFSHGMKELRILMRHPKYKTEYCRTFHTSKYKNIFFPSLILFKHH